MVAISITNASSPDEWGVAVDGSARVDVLVDIT
jgi:hypothetical protein